MHDFENFLKIVWEQCQLSFPNIFHWKPNQNATKNRKFCGLNTGRNVKGNVYTTSRLEQYWQYLYHILQEIEWHTILKPSSKRNHETTRETQKKLCKRFIDSTAWK